MRPLLRAASAKFRIHLSPPVSYSLTTATTPTPAAKCDSHTCPWWPYSDSKDFRTNATIILIILFGALICALSLNAAVRYLLRRRCRLHRPTETQGVLEQHQPKPAFSSTAAQLAAPPTLVFSAGMKLAGSEAECTICLSEFVEGEGIRELGRCNHGFHVQCIQKWLTSHSSCPTCRAICLPSSSSSSGIITGCHLGNDA